MAKSLKEDVSKKSEEIVMKKSKESLDIMASDKFKTEFKTILRTRYPIFYVVTNEERRFKQFLSHFCNIFGYKCYLWDVFNGLVDLKNGEVSDSISDDIRNPRVVLEEILNKAKEFVNNKQAVKQKKEKNVKGIIYVLLDFFHFFQEDNPDPDIERRLKDITNLDGIVTTIITGPSYVSNSVLENLIPLFEFPRPNKEEIKNALWQVVNGVGDKIPEIEKITRKKEEELINAVSGLTIMEAQTAYCKSIVSYKNWNLPTIFEEKRQIIAKSGILDFYDTSLTIKNVGGLKNLIEWIKTRKQCFTKEAEKYGLQKPKGLLTIGLPGCVLANTKIKVKKISKEGKYKIYEK